jgi:hypothetical protein
MTIVFNNLSRYHRRKKKSQKFQPKVGTKNFSQKLGRKFLPKVGPKIFSFRFPFLLSAGNEDLAVEKNPEMTFFCSSTFESGADSTINFW